MATNTDTKKAFIIRDFADAGTEERFTAGATADIPAGTFANYEAAGLVRTADEAKPKPDAPQAAPKAS